MPSIRMIVFPPLLIGLAGCGLVEADPSRFERWAQGVAAIPVTYEEAGLRGPIASAEALGLRGPVELGPRSPMRIEVVEPEVLWEARADGRRGTSQSNSQAIAEAVVQQAVEQAVQQAPEVAEEVVRVVTRTIQLGAFSSRSAAEAAWTQLSAHASLAGATPRYEEIQRDGRTLVRLRAAVEASRASAACQAAGAGQYCTSTGAS